MTAVIHDRLMTDLQALIQALALKGTPGATGDVGNQVYVEQQDMDVNLPCVLISARGLSEEEGESDFEEDAVIYPVSLVICDSPQVNYAVSRPDYLRWRHQIAQALRGLVAYPLLPDCPELADVRLRNLAVLPEDQKGELKPMSGLVALCHTYETRARNG